MGGAVVIFSRMDDTDQFSGAWLNGEAPAFGAGERRFDSDRAHWKFYGNRLPADAPQSLHVTPERLAQLYAEDGN